MYTHTDKYGRIRKFVSKAACNQWLLEQARTYVPDYVPDDIHHTLGVGQTYGKAKPFRARKLWHVT